MSDLESIFIPRCYHPNRPGEMNTSEIDAFSDASDKAIATVMYLKVTNTAGDVKVSFLFAQARLSPKKATTIPRPELCAAVLSAQAAKRIIRELQLNINEVVFYTDSKVVLGYIQNEKRRFYVYVANRVQLIRSISHPSQWRYVDTLINPADIATRGKSAKQTVKSSWFNGPEFLWNTPPSQTTSNPELYVVDNDPEVRPEVTTYAIRVKETKGLGSERFSRFSKWSALRRALANLIIKAKQVKLRLQ